MKKTILFGLLTMTLLSACSKNDKSGNDEEEDPGKIIPEVPFDQLPSSEATFTVNGTTTYVNVMGTQRKPLPEFASLQPKADKVRGYVKDTYGRPLKGAAIGISSSVAGGVSTPASGVTNDKGYYEFAVPFGVARYYNTGYAIDFEGHKAALGLYPADGQLSSTWTSSDGMVENFVMLPYGQGDPAKLATEAHFSNNYFGGSITFSWAVGNDTWALPLNMEFEVKLTPLALVHAAEKKTFIVRKIVNNSTLMIVNLPLGKYRVDVRRVGGAVLKMEETIFNPREGQYGLSPKASVTGSATYTVVATSGDATTPLPFRGHWEDVSINLQR
jgi:hypothetical protein